MLEKKKILQISNYYYPEIGGIEKIAQAITDSVRDKYKVKVVCFTHDKKPRRDKIDGVSVIRCETQAKIASQQIAIRMGRIIKRQIQSFDPDIIIIHLPNPFLEWLLLKYIKPDCKLIVYWHSDIVKQKIGEKLFKGLTEKLLKWADSIIATSPNYIDGSYYLNKYREKCTVIPNCINHETLIPNEKVLEKSAEIRSENDGKNICLCVGRQVPYKGFEYAIKAVKSLGEEYVLYLLGRNGESTPALKELAKGCNRIKFLGEVDDDTLHAYMHACDIFCFSSITKNEAFGIALAEGMYYSKPAVTFTIPGSGVNYVSLDNVTGIEVPNGDTEGYAEAIRLLGENKDLREQYGNAAGKRVRDMFLQDAFGKNILYIIKTVDDIKF